jgi:hypothetical protein
LNLVDEVCFLRVFVGLFPLGGCKIRVIPIIATKIAAIESARAVGSNSDFCITNEMNIPNTPIVVRKYPANVWFSNMSSSSKRSTNTMSIGD